MDAVSVFDHIITAIREARFTDEEVREILQEFWAAYPEAFEQAGLQGAIEPDWKDYDPESRPY